VARAPHRLEIVYESLGHHSIDLERGHVGCKTGSDPRVPYSLDNSSLVQYLMMVRRYVLGVHAVSHW